MRNNQQIIKNYLGGSASFHRPPVSATNGPKWSQNEPPGDPKQLPREPRMGPRSSKIAPRGSKWLQDYFMGS